jgi:hypothetical protein
MENTQNLRPTKYEPPLIQGHLLEMKFFFLLFLRLGKTCTPLVTFKISLISFDFRIYKIMTQRKIYEFDFRAVIWRSFFSSSLFRETIIKENPQHFWNAYFLGHPDFKIYPPPLISGSNGFFKDKYIYFL